MAGYPPPHGYPAGGYGGYGYYPPAPPPQAAAPQQGQQGQQQSSTSVVVVSNDQNKGTGVMVLRDLAVTVTCPACKQHVLTNIKYEIGCMTILIGAILCFFGFYLCCLIPCCVGSCKDVVHMCPCCGNIIGRYKRM